MNRKNRYGRKLRRGWELILAIPQLRFGLLLLTAIVLMAILAPVIAPYDPFSLEGTAVSPPSGTNLLGTDGLGRDVFSGLLYGARTSIVVGLVAATISGVIGTLIGGVAGFFGGRFDQIVSEIINIFLMLPTFFLILIIVALFGSSLLNVMVVIGLTTWTGNAVLMRAQALTLRERTYVKSLQALGESQFKILIKHIIPNGIFPIVANTTMNISGAILTESALSFLGLGDPNLMSWGQMVYHGKSYLTNGWWISTFSGAIIVVTVLAFYLIGDGMNNVLSPKLLSKK